MEIINLITSIIVDGIEIIRLITPIILVGIGIIYLIHKAGKKPADKTVVANNDQVARKENLMAEGMTIGMSMEKK